MMTPGEFQPVPASTASDRFNRVYIAITFFMLAVGGSLGSFLTFFFGISAVAMIGIGHVSFKWRRSDRLILVSCLAFSAALAVPTLVYADAGSPTEDLFKLGAFLLPPFIVSGLRETPADRILPQAFLGISAGGGALLITLLVEFALNADRASGFAGNSGPLAVTSLLVTGFAGLAIGRLRGSSGNALAALALVGGIVGVLLSGMRGSWPALPLCLAIVALARAGDIARAVRSASRLFWTMSLVCAGILAILVVWVMMPLIIERVTEFQNDLAALTTTGGDETSLGLRLAMYDAGLVAIANAPLFGHGMQNIWTALGDAPGLPSTYDFSHLHNIFLTVGVGAGAVGLVALVVLVCAPLWTAWRYRGRGEGRDRLAVAAILVVSFLIPGMTNIMFFHDILDGAWVLVVCIIAASIPDERETAHG